MVAVRDRLATLAAGLPAVATRPKSVYDPKPTDDDDDDNENNNNNNLAADDVISRTAGVADASPQRLNAVDGGDNDGDSDGGGYDGDGGFRAAKRLKADDNDE